MTFCRGFLRRSPVMAGTWGAASAMIAGLVEERSWLCFRCTQSNDAWGAGKKLVVGG